MQKYLFVRRRNSRSGTPTNLSPQQHHRQVLIVRAMRITIFLILTCVVNLYATGYSQEKLTLSLKGVKLAQVFSIIQQQTNYQFLYNDEDIQNAPPVSVVINDATVPQILAVCFTKNYPLEYWIQDSTVVVLRKPSVSYTAKIRTKIEIPQFTITGKVTDSLGNPLMGVSVGVKGTSSGTVTDVNGDYSLTLEHGEGTLIFSYVGYTQKEVSVNGHTAINVKLSASVSSLNQLVVVGYGTQKKKSVTAAISSINGQEVASIPVTDLSNSLGGRASGVIVRQDNGRPGSDGSAIYIRGISSIGATQPLIIVDGIPRDFTQLDPNTIESFTVLKDAAAVAPYGVAGANGVILVTTKSGKIGAPSLTYNGYIGYQNPTILPDFVNGYQFAILQNAAALNSGLPIPYSDNELQKLKDGSDPDALPNPNYKDLLIKNPVITNHNIQLSGGTENVKYYGSLGYQYQEGMWPTVKNKRYNLDMKLDVQATKTTKVTLAVNGRVHKIHWPAIAPGRLWELIGYTDTRNGPLYFSNGMPGSYITGSILTSGYHNVNTTAIYSQLSIEQQLVFIPGLKIQGTIAYDPSIQLDKLWRTPVHKAAIDTSQDPYVIQDAIFEQTKPSLDENFNKSHQITYQVGLNYAKTLGKSNVSALALFEAKGNHALSLGASRRNYNLSVDEISMGSSSQADMTTSGTSSDARQVGLVYRITYDYAGKYLFEASGRYDGNYYFAPDKRFGFFPAFSIGWRLSEENFMTDIKWIDNLKVRGSYGEVGALAGSPFQYLSTYDVYGPAYVLSGEAVQGASERAENNPNITWERAKKYDIGLDASFWKGLLSIEADYFYGKRSNMLVSPNVIIPQEYGIGLSQVNAGIMKNQGIDLSINSTYKVSNDFQISLGGNFTYAKNTLLQVFETDATYNNPNRRRTGKPLGTLFGYHALGFFQSSDFNDDGSLEKGIAMQPWGKVQPGDIRYEDINRDGKIDNDDLTSIGYPSTPQIIYGISPSVSYKGLRLDLLFQGSANVDAYMDQWKKWAFYNGMSAYVDNFNYWTPETPDAKYPRITSAPTTNNTQTSSFWVQDASYLRLKNATLAYTIPSFIAEKISIQNIRVYISGQNIITWSKMINYDPESTGAYSNLYPQQKVVTLGLNVTF